MKPDNSISKSQSLFSSKNYLEHFLLNKFLLILLIVFTLLVLIAPTSWDPVEVRPDYRVRGRPAITTPAQIPNP